MEFHTEGNFTQMFKDDKIIQNYLNLLEFSSHNSLFSPSQSAQLLIKHGETLPDYREVKPGGASSETGDQFANSSNCTLVLLK